MITHFQIIFVNSQHEIALGANGWDIITHVVGREDLANKEMEVVKEMLHATHIRRLNACSTTTQSTYCGDFIHSPVEIEP